ncbi:metallophosphoesterase [Clostridium sp.]|uniref:metallophosphoesterase n=1 Tax=Clostridium sp. TaxID=1506 RepID=UPI00283CE4B9|nr:metallophosphoesterase [Clostridium sp.]MDR3597258.1 metallophosphoesterase [Clostridium sp.]
MTKNIALLSSLSLIAAATYLDNKLLKVSKYNVKSTKIPKEFDKFKIIQLSDFHNYKFLGKDNNIVVNKINEENPDIIVMTGDMVNKYDRNFKNFFALTEVLSKKYELYYIVGNHEKRLKKDYFNFFIERLEKLGIKILTDKKITIIRKKDYINIYGMDIPLSYYKTNNKPSNINDIVDTALNKCNEKEYNILLAHNPLYFDIYAKHNVDLTLSGHVHGGMIRLPFIGGVLSPERKFFPKYNSGIYSINNKKLIVSRGMGHSKPGIRIFNMPEIVSITLFN